MWLSTGTTARMRRHQSRCWLAAALGLSGSAQLAAGNGALVYSCAGVQGLDVLSVRHRNKTGSPSPHLLKLSLPAWLSGTMSAMVWRAGIHTRSLLAATSWCTGSAHAVQEGSHIAGQLDLIAALAAVAGVQFVLASKLVSATLWSPCFLLWQLSWMWIRMALHLLK